MVRKMKITHTTCNGEDTLVDVGSLLINEYGRIFYVIMLYNYNFALVDLANATCRFTSFPNPKTIRELKELIGCKELTLFSPGSTVTLTVE